MMNWCALTWTRAENLFPGCSAEWDAIAVNLSEHTVEQFFENAGGGLSLLIYLKIGTLFYTYGRYRKAWVLS